MEKKFTQADMDQAYRDGITDGLESFAMGVGAIIDDPRTAEVVERTLRGAVENTDDHIRVIQLSQMIDPMDWTSQLSKSAHMMVKA